MSGCTCDPTLLALSPTPLPLATARMVCRLGLKFGTWSLQSSRWAASTTSCLSIPRVSGCRTLFASPFGPYFASRALIMSDATSNGSAILHASEPGTSVDMIMALAWAFLVIHSSCDTGFLESLDGGEFSSSDGRGLEYCFLVLWDMSS